jgi:hypothetical protein
MRDGSKAASRWSNVDWRIMQVEFKYLGLQWIGQLTTGKWETTLPREELLEKYRLTCKKFEEVLKALK